MAVEIDVSYLGNLHCEAVHGPSGGRLRTDSPVDAGGQGSAFSPTDLLATALGTCVLTTMGALARRRGIEMSEARARVLKEMVADPRRRVGSLVVEVTLPATLSAEERSLLEAAGRACPVDRSLHPDVKVELTFVGA